MSCLHIALCISGLHGFRAKFAQKCPLLEWNRRTGVFSHLVYWSFQQVERIAQKHVQSLSRVDAFKHANDMSIEVHRSSKAQRSQSKVADCPNQSSKDWITIAEVAARHRFSKLWTLIRSQMPGLEAQYPTEHFERYMSALNVVKSNVERSKVSKCLHVGSWNRVLHRYTDTCFRCSVFTVKSPTCGRHAKTQCFWRETTGSPELSGTCSQCIADKHG